MRTLSSQQMDTFPFLLESFLDHTLKRLCVTLHDSNQIAYILIKSLFLNSQEDLSLSVGSFS